MNFIQRIFKKKTSADKIADARQKYFDKFLELDYTGYGANSECMGGTEESVAAAKEANNQAVAEAASQIAVNGERRKDQIESQYLSTKQELNDKLNNLEQAKAQNTAQAVQGVAQAGSAMASVF